MKHTCVFFIVSRMRHGLTSHNTSGRDPVIYRSDPEGGDTLETPERTRAVRYGPGVLLIVLTPPQGVTVPSTAPEQTTPLYL